MGFPKLFLDYSQKIRKRITVILGLFVVTIFVLTNSGISSRTWGFIAYFNYNNMSLVTTRAIDLTTKSSTAAANEVFNVSTTTKTVTTWNFNATKLMLDWTSFFGYPLHTK